jgi:tungstate transport system ATP-binding protein
VTTPKLALRDLTLVRGGRTLLAVPELAVMPGEVLAVLGPNGAGKSTLLRVMALLERPTSGQVLWEGEPVRGDPLPYRRRLALVFQEPLLLDMTVEANVRLGLALRGLPGREQARRAAYWLERLGIAHLARRSPRHLSGGEAQRVSLARALALSPEVLLLDEPFASLDPPTRQELVAELESLLRETGTTAVLVAHDRAHALRLGQRLAVLMEGRLRQVGPPEVVFSRPADPQVALFLGVENVLPGEVVGGQGGLAQVRVGPHLLWALAHQAPAAGRVWACVRPEHIVLAPLGRGEEAGSARNRLPATVVRLSAEGPGQPVRVDLDCGFPLVAYVTAASAEQLGLAPGVPVVASFKALALHLIGR